MPRTLVRGQAADRVGVRLATRRPVGLPAAVAVHLLAGLLLASPLALTRPDGWPPYAAGAFALGALVVFLVLGEVLTFRHHVHEHAVVTTAMWPYRTRVVPFYSVDPDSVHGGGYVRADGTMRDARNPRYRQVPGRPTLRLDGLRPDRATLLARGRVGWNEAFTARQVLGPVDVGLQPVRPVTWVLGWPSADLEADLDLVRGLAAAHD